MTVKTDDEMPEHFCKEFRFWIEPHGSQMDTAEVEVCRDYADSDTGALVCELLSQIGYRHWEEAGQTLAKIREQEG